MTAMANASKTVLGPGRILGYSSLAAVEWKNGPPLLKNPGSNCGYTHPCSPLDHFKTSSGFWMSDARHILTGSARTRVGGASRGRRHAVLLRVVGRKGHSGRINRMAA